MTRVPKSVRDYMAQLGRNGGLAGTKKQTEARKKNAKKARQARKAKQQQVNSS